MPEGHTERAWTGTNTGDIRVSDSEDYSNERRDFIHYATAGMGAVVAGAALWPLVNQMNPSADVLALSLIDVDVSDVSPGTQITVKWQGKPVFIRRRTAEEITQARATPLADLVDEDARNDNTGPVPALDTNRSLDENGEWLVMVGICTHLGCVPLGDGAGEFGGWFCPCHGSHYDVSGRIRKGPAPTNMAVPRAAFTNATTIKIG